MIDTWSMKIVNYKYKVEGESSDGNYLDGLWFETKEDADREIWMLRQEFPENNYWVEIE